MVEFNDLYLSIPETVCGGNENCLHFSAEQCTRHPQDVHACEFVTLESKRNFADVIMLRILRWG